VASVEDQPPSTVAERDPGGGAARSWRAAAAPIADFLRDDLVALVILIGAFILRWFLAGTQSYWLDELYSVAIYGVWNDSALEAVRNLANSSVHPPLYQFILYQWMDWLGDSEVVTRNLSNLYVTAAGLFLYLLTRDAFSRLIAAWSTVLYSVMYTTMFFGLETRSYGQTIFLVTLSSYLVLRIMHAGMERGWRSSLATPSGAFLVLANTALLLTHYYNVFFLIAQGLCAVAFVLILIPRAKWLTGLGAVTAGYTLPIALFAAIWGRIFIDTYGRRAGEYAVEGGSDLVGPIEVLNSSVVEPNLLGPGPVLVLGAIITAAMFARTAVVLKRSETSGPEKRSAFTTLYLGSWLVLPVAITHVVFTSLGVARYSDRYFLFSTIPLAPIVILTIDETWRLGKSVSQRLRRIPNAALIGVTSAIIVATAILPGSHAAATSDKADWNGTAEAVAGIVEADPDSSYTIYETSFRTTPVLDYYLAQYSESIRVDGTIRRAEERRGHNYAFERNDETIRQHDYLIVVFTHHSTEHFPIALEALGRLFQVHHSHLDSNGRGYIVFRVR